MKCETTDSIFSSTGVRTHCDVDEASQAPADQTPTVNTDGDIVISNITSLQIKMESAEEDNGATVSGEAEIKTEQSGKSDKSIMWFLRFSIFFIRHSSIEYTDNVFTVMSQINYFLSIYNKQM